MRIQAFDDTFQPGVVRVAPGTTVTWVNVGHNPHTVTSDDASADSGNLWAAPPSPEPSV